MGNKPLQIFVYGNEDYISKSIIHSGEWEQYWLLPFINYVHHNPKVQFIDIGCNLGVYTLTMASLGIKVIGIDANKNNTDRLIQSVIANNLTPRVTLILNALSDVRKSFKLSRLTYNIGAQFLKQSDNDLYQVQSVLMDDLLPVIDDDCDVIMKIDIEHHENRAFKAAHNLFKKRNVKVILIEWSWLRKIQGTESTIEFMVTRNYKPYRDFNFIEELITSNYRNWPDEVLWKKN